MAAATRTNRRRVRSPATPDASTPAPANAMATLILDETLDLRAATGLKAALLAHRGADIQVDASAVLHLGAQCAQLLAAADAAWAADGATLAFPAASEAFAQGARLLGLDSTLCSKGART